MDNFDFLSEDHEHKVETYDEANARYDGFGKGFFEAFKKEFPHLFHNLTFYQQIAYKGIGLNQNIQDEDSYAVYNDGNVSFLIQLNYYSVICIVDFRTFTEIGHWHEDPIKAGIIFIKENFLRNPK